MKIKALELKLSDVENSGLGEFYSTKFNSVIALVGKNGSGKSRYLKAIENSIKNCDLTTDFEKNFSSVPSSFAEVRNEYLKDPRRYQAYNELLKAQGKAAENPLDKSLQTKANEAANNYNLISGNQFNINKFIKNNNLI